MQTDEVVYHVPDTLEQALALLSEHRAAAALLAGGTDLVPALKYRVLQAYHLVSLKRIPGLRHISISQHGDLSVGALATLRDVAVSPLVRTVCPALAEAASQAGSPLLRNRGTLGGNVCLDTRCWYYNQTETWRANRGSCQKAAGKQCYVNEKQNRCVALFSADTPPALIIAGALATLIGPHGERTIPVEALYSGDGLRPLVKGDAEIITTITVPAPPSRWGTAYLKHSVRESIDFPVLGVAAAVGLGEDGVIREARVALTGAMSAPLRLFEAEAALRGRRPPGESDRALAQLVTRSIGSLFLSEAVPHKRWLAGLLTVEAVGHATAAAKAGRVS